MLRSRGFPDTHPSLLGTLREAGAPQAAWREFFDYYAPSVYRIARRYGLGAQDADEVVQLVMVAVSRHISAFQYNRDRGRFRQWIKTLTTRKVFDLTRQLQARPDRVQLPGIEQYACEEEADSSVVSAWEQEWRAQDLRFCLQQVRQEIAPKRFRAFEMYVLEGVSAKETGQQLGMSRTHVYVTRTQVIRRVRELMRELTQAEGEA